MALVLSLTATIGVAEVRPAENTQEQQNIELALGLARQSATKYEFHTNPNGSKVTLREQPILQWSNPERGQIYGNVFLWTTNGRPAVVGSLFKWFSPYTHASHEFHSLSENPLTARFGDKDVWKTSASGVKFSMLANAPSVATTPSARLVQMRQLARQFTVRRTERDGQINEMRLLSQPVYRYEHVDSQTGLLDGALFVFVQGTDPEVWLLLEARHEPGDTSATWNYAVARMNSVGFAVEFDRQQVAQLEIVPSSQVYSHKEPYTSFQFDR